MDANGLQAEVGPPQWPVRAAPRAIEALAAAGRVVVGLDVRAYDRDGRVRETPWSVCAQDPKLDRATNIRRCTQAALDALDQGIDGRAWVRVHIT